VPEKPDNCTHTSLRADDDVTETPVYPLDSDPVASM
jgi:hypothetical protein